MFSAGMWGVHPVRPCSIAATLLRPYRPRGRPRTPGRPPTRRSARSPRRPRSRGSRCSSRLRLRLPAMATWPRSRSRGNPRKPGTATQMWWCPPAWPTCRRRNPGARRETRGSRAASSGSAPPGCTSRTRGMLQGPRAWPPPSLRICWTSLTTCTAARCSSSRSSRLASPRRCCRRHRRR